MRLRLLVVVAVAVKITISTDVGKCTACGEFDYNGVKCKWYENRETGSLRSLNIQCRGSKPFSTKYKGDPHKCGWYQKDKKQKAYYECLVSALKKARFSISSPSEIACDKKNCGDVKFRKENVGSSLFRLIMKTAEVKEVTMETEEPDWSEFDLFTGFN